MGAMRRSYTRWRASNGSNQTNTVNHSDRTLVRINLNSHSMLSISAVRVQRHPRTPLSFRLGRGISKGRTPRHGAFPGADLFR